MGAKRQTGLSLVFALIIISVMVTAALHYNSRVAAGSERQAYEYTFAQLQNTLNLAYSFRQRQGQWPLDRRGDCEMPDEYLDWDDHLTNGWGYRLEGGDDCDRLDDQYVVEQTVPEYAVALFQNTMTEEVSSFRVNQAGLRGMRVVLDNREVETVLMDIEEADNSEWDGTRMTQTECGSDQTLTYIIGMNGFCAKEVPPENIMAFAGFSSITVDSGDVNFVGVGQKYYWIGEEAHEDGAYLSLYSELTDNTCSSGVSSEDIRFALFSWCQ